MLRTMMLLAFALGAAAQSAPVLLKGKPKPPAIANELWLLPADWSARLPPGGAVNAPRRMETLSPGQKIAVALIAHGDGRLALLAGRTLTLKIKGPAGVAEFPALTPVSTREIKAEGADFVLGLLQAGGIGDAAQTQVEGLSAMTTLVIFEPEWRAPEATTPIHVEMEAAIGGGNGPAPKLKRVKLSLRPWSAWLADEPPTGAALETAMMGYDHGVQPGRLFALLKGAARAGLLDRPDLLSFYTAAFRASPEARVAALGNLSAFDAKGKAGLLMVMRRAGLDASAAEKSLSDTARSSLAGIEPETEPCRFPEITDAISANGLQQFSTQMDRCWNHWIATGAADDLRSIVALLSYAPDFPAYQDFIKTKPGPAGFNGAVARGIVYRTAGWSLGSFDRTDGLAADWFVYWRKDPKLPELLRKELAGLQTNPTFRDEQR